MVSKPSLSSVQVRLLPSPSAPQVPLSTMSAASAVAGRSDAIISTASTKLKSRFFICSPPCCLRFSRILLRVWRLERHQFSKKLSRSY